MSDDLFNETECLFFDLAQPFDKRAVKWRVGSTWDVEGTRMGKPLCYVDARVVMNRLDDVVGPENWQDNYIETPKRIICNLGIRIGDDWIWKSDGAGDTDIEGEKGGMSDAFKRAAVKFGIGRYLYAIHVKGVELKKRGKGWTLPDNFNGGQYLPEPSFFPSKMMKTKTYKALKAAAAEDDELKARETWNGLDMQQKNEIWHDLKHSSGVRSALEALLKATEAA